MIVAGEVSGDLHAAKLAVALRETATNIDFEFFGAAGAKMREVGVTAVVRSDGLAIVGLADIGRALPMFLRASRDLKRLQLSTSPTLSYLSISQISISNSPNPLRRKG